MLRKLAKVELPHLLFNCSPLSSSHWVGVAPANMDWSLMEFSAAMFKDWNWSFVNHETMSWVNTANCPAVISLSCWTVKLCSWALLRLWNSCGCSKPTCNILILTFESFLICAAIKPPLCAIAWPEVGSTFTPPTCERVSRDKRCAVTFASCSGEMTEIPNALIDWKASRGIALSWAEVTVFQEVVDIALIW